MGDTVLAPPHKRPRISLACVACRERKTRCDGRRPICLACEIRGIAHTCIYARARRTSPLRRVESNGTIFGTTSSGNLTSRSHEPSHLPMSNQKYVLPSDQGLRTIMQQQSESLPGTGQVLQGTAEVSSYKHGRELSVDGLATVPTYSDRDRLYGPSSSLAFSRSLVPEVAGLNEDNDDNAGYSRNRGTTTRESAEHLPSYKREVTILPRRGTADDFLRCYLDFIHPVFPILHTPTFIKQYEQFWTSTDSEQTKDADLREAEDVIFVSILNLVFALGSQFSHIVALTQRSETSDSFYQRSRRTYCFDILDSPSLSVVQMLLLTGVYLQSSQYATRCWNAVGLAIRAAQSLGLHVDSVDKRSRTQLHVEMGRRIWHNCVSLDRLLAMTFGRPTMVASPSAVVLPIAIDDEYLNTVGSGTQPQGVGSYMQLFVFSCKLFDILDDVLQIFYVRNTSTGLQKQSISILQLEELITSTLDISRRLNKFWDTVPSELLTENSPFISAADKYRGLNLQQQVLYCRFLYVKMLSLRPLLLYTTKHQSISYRRLGSASSSYSLDDELIRRSCRQCLETAHELVKALHENLETPFRSAGWHAVYFTFSAASIILASSRSSMMETDLRDELFEIFWQQCLSILRKHEIHIRTASQAIHVLEMKKNHMLTDGTHNHEFHDNGSKSKDAGNDRTVGNTDTEFLPQEIHMDHVAHPYIFEADRLSETWLDDCLAELDSLEPMSELI